MQHFTLQFRTGSTATYFYQVNRKFHSAQATIEGHTKSSVKIRFKDEQGQERQTRVKPVNLTAMSLGARIAHLPDMDRGLIMAMFTSAPGPDRLALAQELVDLILSGVVLHKQYYLVVDPRTCIVNDYQSLIHLEGPAGELYITFPNGFTFLASKC